MKFKSTFDGYSTIDNITYYLISNKGVVYLINCKDHPEYVGELTIGNKIEIEADFDRQVFQGGVLKNVKFGGDV